ncbi:unnamed protein product [Allacma fusca]|uniref:Protein kinase domain-containing protein n=1 Tax=Allacma fusca TaxID=39272 RepID=A0A8J2K827_9HEXA|nr:unnamed protein product [Allacma fusca]
MIPAREDRAAGWSEIVFLKVDFGLEGHYYCVATNDEGSSKRFYHVIVDEVSNAMTIVVSVIAAAVFIIMVMLLIHLKLKNTRHHQALKHISKEEVQEFREGDEKIINNSEDYIGSAQVLIQAQPYNSKYEIPRKHFFVYNHLVLGSGEFGIVVEGAIQLPQDGRMIQVAVKTVRPNVDLQYFRALLSEVKVMTCIGRHPHIVNIVGACTKDIRKSEILLAVEYCRKGNLRDFLRKSREGFKNQIEDGKLQPLESIVEGAICTRDLIRWSCEIANGMDFLSSKNIIHADLACRNILLTESLVAKISDFGLSRQLMDYSNYVKKHQCPLPWKWMAIESLKDMHFSIQSDVWSYGVLLWETFSLGEVPYPGQNWSHEFLNDLVAGKRLVKPTYATDTIYELMLECWNEDLRGRPKFFKLKEKFEGVLADVSNQDYLDLLQSEYQHMSNPPEELCFNETTNKTNYDCDADTPLKTTIKNNVDTTDEKETYTCTDVAVNPNYISKDISAIDKNGSDNGTRSRGRGSGRNTFFSGIRAGRGRGFSRIGIAIDAERGRYHQMRLENLSRKNGFMGNPHRGQFWGRFRGGQGENRGWRPRELQVNLRAELGIVN